MASNQTDLTARMSRSCDRCKVQKVRCIVPPTSTICENCAKRNKPCHFGPTKRLLKRSNRGGQEDRWRSPTRDLQHALPVHRQSDPGLYIDRVLTDPQAAGVTNSTTSLLRAHESHIAITNLAFFSDSKIRLISERLGHNKLQNLLEDNEAHINDKLIKTSRPTRSPIKFELPSEPVLVDFQVCCDYVNAYFENVHPLYPLLDRTEFEAGIRNFNPTRDISTNPPLSALYHAVLALGCQQTGNGSFHPGKGQAWKFYQVSLGFLPQILYPSDNLVNLQAITTMAIFSLNMSCLQIMGHLITEAARMAHTLGYQHRVQANGNETSCYRTFWVIYCLERLRCLLCNRGPLLLDHDIGCPIPNVPEATFAGFNFFLGCIKISRLISKAHQQLYSISATMRTPDQYDLAIQSLHDDLEHWKATLPPNFRPGQLYRPMEFRNQPGLGMMILRLHYMYYALLISLCRLRLHVNNNITSMEKTKQQLLVTSHLVIQLTRYIDKTPCTPLWVSTVVPISAMFVLFDFIIFNPLHPETEFNLALMDVAATYFLRLESVIDASLCCSKLTGFAHIANDFIQDSLYGLSPSTRESAAYPIPIHQNQVLVTVGLNNTVQSLRSIDDPASVDEMTSEAGTDLSPSSLLYPIASSQPYVDGSFTLGFEFSDLFDLMAPQLPS